MVDKNLVAYAVDTQVLTINNYAINRPDQLTEFL